MADDTAQKQKQLPPHLQRGIERASPSRLRELVNFMANKLGPDGLQLLEKKLGVTAPSKSRAPKTNRWQFDASDRDLGGGD